MIDGEYLLKPREVALRLSLSTQSVYRMIQAGRLKTVKIDDCQQGQLRIRLSEVNAFIDSLTEKEPTARTLDKWHLDERRAEGAK
jgi:excisionase family DNA binding protein